MDMKKIISILFLFIMFFSVVGCTADIQKNNAPTGSYKNLDNEIKEKIDTYVKMINIILDLNWSSECPEDLWMESSDFGYVLDELYRHEHGYAPSDNSNTVKVSDYADVASRYFNIDEVTLRSILSTGIYDFSTDSLLYDNSIEVSANIIITKVVIDENTYTVDYTRKYEGYEDSDYFVARNRGVLIMTMDENGCTFISNKVKRSEYDSIDGDRLKHYFQRYITALGDMLNYSWDENGKGTLFTEPYDKSVQAYIDRANAALIKGKITQNWAGYVSATKKFLSLEDEMILQALGYDGENYVKYTQEEIQPDSGNFRIIDSIEYKDGLYYINYLNGIRNYDVVTGRYQLQNSVKSQLVVENVHGRPIILANRNAYYDVFENERFQHYLDVLAPVLKYNWDENTINPLTQDINALKVAAQNLNYNYNFNVWDGKSCADYYKQIIDRYFEFGLPGCEYSFSTDENYNPEDEEVVVGLNTEDTEKAQLTDVVYNDDDVIIYYKQGNNGGLITLRKYSNGIEKFVSNRYNYRRLTKEEIEQINNYYQLSDVWKYTLMAESFDSPQRICLESLLYNITSDTVLHKGCYYEIKKAKEKDLQLDFENLENGSKTYTKVLYDDVRYKLKQEYNIYPEDVANLDGVVYSDLYKCFYVSPKVIGYPHHEFTDGYIENDTVVFFSDVGKVSLKKVGDKYYIDSYVYGKRK